MTKSKLQDKRVVFVSSSLLKSGKIDMQKRDFIHDGRSDEVDTDTNETKRKSFAPTGYCD
eukprot:CAMPEP_0113424562 /NCGR_PEP_ID=MMETSP0013_2-20120614/29667_1 /TAXON_ID=2843 ORGANISM="Skeletonema costatum, Strain 1716" /NCGR_SAMPLE_ID=MMETSP0013_2 /ASSEMBLY_ACC=CAM_ASM_000158 /LENGTH=59 /DNA_ID=CAMNT_0000312595 /DNA_START=81 /DNA_END=257 /DNA_ORIENTATION=+ /assembly_acc=CAM_ASM_000158